MNKAEIIELMAQTHCDQTEYGWHSCPPRSQKLLILTMTKVYDALRAAGLAVVPVVATESLDNLILIGFTGPKDQYAVLMKHVLRGIEG